MLAIPQLAKNPRPDVLLWVEIWRIGRPIRENIVAELGEGCLRWRGMKKGLAIQQDAKAPPQREIPSHKGPKRPHTMTMQRFDVKGSGTATANCLPEDVVNPKTLHFCVPRSSLRLKNFFGLEKAGFFRSPTVM